MEHLLELIARFNAYAQLNPMIAGAMSLWGLGILTWVCRGVPAAIWRFCKRQFTTSLAFTSDSAGTGAETFANFMRWFQASPWAGWSRSLSIVPSRSGHIYYGPDHPESEDEGTVVGVGDGSHFFMYRGWPFWLRHSRIKDGGNMNRVTYEVAIVGFGRNRNRVLDMIEEFRYRPSPSRTGVFRYGSRDWCRVSDVAKRPLETVVIDQSIKDSLVGNIRDWMASREWYEQRGLPYKLTCVLRGPPGTGKTSLIKALAGHLGMSVCAMNLSAMTDDSFESALVHAPRNSFVVIEDIDSSTATKARQSLKATAATKKDDDGDTALAQTISGLSLSGILNALDGILSLDGKIVFLTTNAYDVLDPALVRKGRVDHTYEIGRLTDTEVRAYIAVMFPGEQVVAEGRYADILGCDLQDLYFGNRNSAQAFANAIPRVTASALRAA